jgi:glutaredoxin
MILRGFLLLLVAVALPAQAQQYRWMDDKGNTRITDTPPPPGAKNVRKIETASPAKPGSGQAPAAGQVPFELVRLQKDFPVTLYTSPSCKEGCEMARAALNKRGVPFKEVQVWNAETNEVLKAATGALEVPSLTVGRSSQRGFQPDAFDALLDSAGYPKAGTLPAGTQKAPGAPEGYVGPGGLTAEPVKPEVAGKPGRYDPSGLQGPEPKPGRYDPSKLEGPAPKPGRYGVPEPK